jgi:hypothetical protein
MKTLLPLLFFFTACGTLTIKDADLVKSDSGYYVPQLRGREMSALRDSEKNLAFTQEEAKKIQDQLKNQSSFEKRIPQHCQYPMDASDLFHRIERELETKNWIAADQLMARLEKDCPDIKYLSYLDYLKGYAAHEQGRGEEAHVLFKNFLTKSEGIWPKKFFQEDSYQERTEFYQKYRLQAQKYLDQKISPELFLSDKKKYRIPRFRNDIAYEPGYESTKDHRSFRWVVWPTSNRFESGIAAFYDIHTQYGSFIPGVDLKFLSGPYYNMIYRKSIYQTLDRRHQMGINLNGGTVKKIRYTGTFGYYDEADVVETRIGFGLGLGGTYHFHERWSGIYQVTGKDVFFSDERSAHFTTLGKFRLGEIWNVHAGFLDDNVVSGLDLDLFYLSYNFSDRGILLGIRGLNF